MRVLYVNQLPEVSGAERSLLELIDGLGEGVEPHLACPPGPLMDAAAARGIATHPIVGTKLSFRLHPLHTPRGVAGIVRSARQVRGLANRLQPAIVHANTTRAGYVAELAGHRGSPPAIVHIRDWVPPGPLGKAALAAAEITAAGVITNSGYIADSVPLRRRIVHVVHDAVDLARFDPNRISREAARKRLGLDPDAEVLAHVAHFIPWKAQDDSIRILARLRASRPRLRLILAGSAKFSGPARRYDTVAFERRLRAMVASEGLESRVLFLGERDDVPEVLRAADLLLVPSWREAFGRVAVEAMAMWVPVIATSVGGTGEVVRDGVDGVLLPPREVERWAAAVAELLDSPDRRSAIGERARRRAVEDFAPRRHAERVQAVYDEVLAGRAANE